VEVVPFFVLPPGVRENPVIDDLQGSEGDVFDGTEVCIEEEFHLLAHLEHALWADLL